MSKFTFVQGYTEGEGWQGIYFDGQLVNENHEISIRDVIKLLKSNGVNIKYYTLDSDEYFEKTGRFDKNFTDIPKELLEEAN